MSTQRRKGPRFGAIHGIGLLIAAVVSAFGAFSERDPMLGALSLVLATLGILLLKRW